MTDDREPETLLCSVIIPTRCRPAELDRCLAAVRKLECEFSYDVIVIDNSAGDADTERVARRWGARYVKETRGGLCTARNRGALVSSAEIVAYLDDDSVPEPTWLSAFVREFQDDRVMGAAGKTIPLHTDSDAEQLFAKVRGGAYDRSAHLVVEE